MCALLKRLRWIGKSLCKPIILLLFIFALGGMDEKNHKNAPRHTSTRKKIIEFHLDGRRNEN